MLTKIYNYIFSIKKQTALLPTKNDVIILTIQLGLPFTNNLKHIRDEL